MKQKPVKPEFIHKTGFLGGVCFVLLMSMRFQLYWNLNAKTIKKKNLSTGKKVLSTLQITGDLKTGGLCLLSLTRPEVMNKQLLKFYHSHITLLLKLEMNSCISHNWSYIGSCLSISAYQKICFEISYIVLWPKHQNKLYKLYLKVYTMYLKKTKNNSKPPKPKNSCQLILKS